MSRRKREEELARVKLEEEEEELDESDLTQLPGVDEKLEKKLKRLGYDTLWDIAYAEAEDLVQDLGISMKEAEEMINAANDLL